MLKLPMELMVLLLSKLTLENMLILVKTIVKLQPAESKAKTIIVSIENGFESADFYSCNVRCYSSWGIWSLW